MTFRFLCFAWSWALSIGLWAAPLVSAAEASTRYFDIPAGEAETTLREFAKQSGVQLIYDAQKLSGVRTAGLRGDHTPRAALDSMLAGTRFYAVQDRETGALTVQRETPGPNPPRAAQAESDRPKPIPVVERADIPKDDVLTLSPFEVTSEGDEYYAGNTTAATRLNSRLEDLASSTTVVTKAMIEDFAMLDINDIFDYEVSTEGSGTFTDISFDRNGSPQENTSTNPTGSNRIRGIGNANISFGNFETNGRVPIDPINLDSVEISRGPNSSVFGLGGAAGTVNIQPASANLVRNYSNVKLRADSYEGYRTSIDLNRVLFKNKLAIRGSAVQQHTGYVRKPSGVDTVILNGMVRYRPFKNTMITGFISAYRSHGIRANVALPRDAIGAWKAAGSPTWDPVTATAKINGVAVPGTWAFNNLPSYFRNDQTAPRTSLFVDKDGIPNFWSQSRSTSNATSPLTGNQNVFLVNTVPGLIRQTQPLFSSDPSVTDKDVYDYTSVNLNTLNPFTERQTTGLIQLEQTILNTPRHLLAIQLGYFTEDNKRRANNMFNTPSGGGLTGHLQIDVNERMIDGSPNPNFLRPFIGLFRVRSDRYTPMQTETSRAQLAYRLDLRREKNLLRWLGMHTISAYGSEKLRSQRNNIYEDQIISNHAWRPLPTTTTTYNGTFPAFPDMYAQPYYRFYVGDAQGYNVDYSPHPYVPGTYEFTWGNGVTGVFNHEPALLAPNEQPANTGGWDKNVLKTRGAALQSFLLKDRVVTTFGIREDRVYDKNPAPKQYTVGPDGWHIVPESLDVLASGDYVYNRGKTTTGGVVVKVTPWLNVHYNASDSFLPADYAQGLFMQELPNPTGEGADYGFSVKLLDGKLIARVNKYTTTQFDSRDGSARTIGQRARSTDFPRTNNDVDSLSVRATGWIQRAAAAQGVTLTTDQLNQRLSEIMQLPLSYIAREETASAANNLISATNDVQAKGLEFELNYRPNAFWRIKFNAAKSESIDKNLSADIVNYIDQRLPVWRSIIDPETGQPWWTSRYGSTQSAETQLRNNTLAPLNIAIATEGKSRPQIRKYKANLSTSYRLAGITDHKWFKAVTVGGALRWEDKGAIGYMGIADSAGIYQELDPTRPIYDKDHLYTDVFISYRTKLFNRKVGAQFQLNVRNLQENGGLKPVAAFPDGTPSAYRIVDPRIFILSVGFDL